MKTPTFNDFMYLHSKIDGGLQKGHYRLEIKFWDNLLLREVETAVVMKTVSVFGGNFKELAIANLILSFMLIMIGIFLSYIHKIKFTDGMLRSSYN